MTGRPLFIKHPTPPPIDQSVALRYAGMRGQVDEVSELLRSCVAEVEGAFSYRVCWRTFPLQTLGEELDLGFARVRSRDLQAHLAGCSEILVLAATVGLEIDRLIARANAHSPTKALLLDALGTERVEALCDALEAELREDAHKTNQSLTRRFSPGYGDLPLELQRNLLAALDAPRSVGITLNQSLLLSPSKSVTAIIGIF